MSAGGVKDGGTEGDREPRPEEPDAVENERVRRFLSDLHRPRDALAVLRFVLRHPDGVPIPVVTEEVLGETPTGRNDRFVRRLIKRNPRFFETDRSQSVYVVAPAPEALNLITGRQISKPPEGTVFDKDTARDLLSDQKMLNETGRQIVLDRFSSYIDRVSQKEVVLRDRTARGERYTVIPYRTRFTDDGRKGAQWRNFQHAWETATEKYDNGCLVTLTTDPKMHDGLLDSWENISDAFNRFMSFLSTDSRLGYRPDYIAVLEPMENGLPHIHLVVFGEPWLIDQRELSNYWARYQGKTVDIRRIRNRDGEWIQPGRSGALIADGGDRADAGDELDDEDMDAKAYLGKYLKKLLDGLDADADDLCNADAEETPAWKLGMHWATDRQILRSSHDLKPENDDDETEVLGAKWEYVGAWNRDELPVRILRNRRAPPKTEEVPVPDGGDNPPPDNPPPDDRPPDVGGGET
jgi:hypothetical protein